MLLFGNPTPLLLLSAVFAALLGMTVHEFAHNYVGHLMGDPVPKREGRLTLNPIVHINWVGFLMFVIIGFGPLGSAPISPYRMRNPRWGFLAAVAAGPFSNLLIAIVAAIVLRIVQPNIFSLSTVLVSVFRGGGAGDARGTIAFLLYIIVNFNVLLFLFNLLPLYPIDGWHVVLSLLPPDLAYTWQRHAQTTQYIFFGLLLLSFARIPGLNIFNILIGQPMDTISRILMGF